jgi:predicted  nucleic acid-binding Zn-ribbon protein
MSGSTKPSTHTFTIWRLTAVQNSMSLTKSERAKITDSVHSIQSARASLADIEEDKVPKVDQIQDCLEDADKELRGALMHSPVKKPGFRRRPAG